VNRLVHALLCTGLGLAAAAVPAVPAAASSVPAGPVTAAHWAGDFPAESFDVSSGVSIRSTAGGIRYVGDVSRGDWVGYWDVNFDTGRSAVKLSVAQPRAGAIEVVLDSLDNAPVAVLSGPVYGTWTTFTDHTASVGLITGYHHVFLRFTSPDRYDFLNVDHVWFS
jgi:hypothetical protein